MSAKLNWPLNSSSIEHLDCERHHVSILLLYWQKKQHILASLRKAEQNIFVPSGLARGFLKSFLKPAPEPSTFNKKVREPGRDFLKNLGITKQGDVADNIPWDKARFWAKCYKELDSAYNYICCYVGMRINNSSNRFESHSVEHFIPKSINPWLAYEWDNYRLACRKANSDRDKKPVIDPFLVGPDDFRLDLFTQKLFPNPILSKQKQQEVKDTIDNIDLNCDYWVKNGQNYYCEYLKMESEEEGRKYLQKNAPILLAELLRPSQKTTVVEDV